MGAKKEHCSGCHKNVYDTRIYYITASTQGALRFCKSCASQRSNIVPANKQKIQKVG